MLIRREEFVLGWGLWGGRREAKPKCVVVLRLGRGGKFICANISYAHEYLTFCDHVSCLIQPLKLYLV